MSCVFRPSRPQTTLQMSGWSRVCGLPGVHGTTKRDDDDQSASIKASFINDHTVWVPDEVLTSNHNTKGSCLVSEGQPANSEPSVSCGANHVCHFHLPAGRGGSKAVADALVNYAERGPYSKEGDAWWRHTAVCGQTINDPPAYANLVFCGKLQNRNDHSSYPLCLAQGHTSGPFGYNNWHMSFPLGKAECAANQFKITAFDPSVSPDAPPVCFKGRDMTGEGEMKVCGAGPFGVESQCDTIAFTINATVKQCPSKTEPALIVSKLRLDYTQQPGGETDSGDFTNCKILGGQVTCEGDHQKPNLLYLDGTGGGIELGSVGYNPDGTVSITDAFPDMALIEHFVDSCKSPLAHCGMSDSRSEKASTTLSYSS